MRQCYRYAIPWCLTVLLLALWTTTIAIPLQDSASITINVKNTSIEQVFRSIERQTAFSIVYNTQLLNPSEKISVRLQQVSIKQAMATILKGRSLKWSVVGKAIIISKDSLPSSSQAVSSDRSGSDTLVTIKGSVTSEDGFFLPRATILAQPGGQGTTTNIDGQFLLTNIPDRSLVTISYTGYETQEHRIMGSETLIIRLKRAVGSLDEVQVIAYGTTSRRMSTGNIGSVKAEEIARQPVSNPLLALQGRVSGLYISQQNGIPGGSVTVRIQGQNSLANGSDPFYVVDGVPYSSETMPMASSAIRGGSTGNGSPFNFLNPNDIESIEVLKDADATSIYGSRAANGAILITTKSGSAGATKFDINLQRGWSKVAKFIDMLNTRQYLEIRREGKRNDNDQNFSADYDINGTWDTTRYTNWQKELIGRTAGYTNMQASLSGGNAGTQFLIGAGYINETTVFLRGNEQPNYKASLNFKINHTSSNKRLKVLFSGNYINTVNNLPPLDLTLTSWTLAPNAPALFTSEGNLNYQPLANGTTTFFNPVANVIRKYNVENDNIIGNIVASYAILPYLELKSSFGYTSLVGNDKATAPSAALPPDIMQVFRSVTRSTSSNIGWIIEPQLQFKKQVGRGKLEVLIGSSFQDNKREFLALSTFGYGSDAQLDNLAAATSITVLSTLQSRYKYNALFGRANYNLNGKYLLNITARRDGSSRFGSENLFNNFWSVGGAWIFSDELFMSKINSFFDFGKIRVSYGTTGNDQIGDYQFMNLYGTVSAPVAYQGAAGLAPQGHTNPYLQWEETHKLNIGLDLGFWKERILLSTNYFRNHSSNQLLLDVLPIQTGFGSVQINLPAVVRNTGLELELNARILDGKDFSWNGNLNFTIPKNKLVSFPGIESSSYNSRFSVGEPVTITKVYSYAGVNAQTGLYEFFDIKGNLTSAPSTLTDKTQIVNTTPVFYGGLSNQLQFKGIELDVLVQYVRQIQTNSTIRFGSTKLGTQGNQSNIVLDRWRMQNDQTNVQRASTTNTAASTARSAGISSNEAYEDGSFARIKNVSISYRIPRKLTGNIFKYGARIYVQGQNLYTFTKYSGFDPESGSASALPPLRTISTGLQLTF